MTYIRPKKKLTSKGEAIDKLQERMLILYGGECRAANDLLHELEFSPTIYSKLITLISEAFWELR